MFHHFICGSGNFHHQEDEDDDVETFTPCSTPKRSSKRSSLLRNKNSRYNPYADRGLDKFSTLLTNLEDKKQKIYTQMGSEDISLVRFVFSKSNSIKPIIVKLKDKNQTSSSDTDDDKQIIKKNSEFVDKKIIHEISNNISEEQKAKYKRRKLFRNLKLSNFKKPAYYMPLAIILILVFLAIYGRCFAILCTSIGWYIIPIIKASSRRTKRKYAKKLSEKKITFCEGTIFPRSVMDGAKDHKLLGGKHGS
ncbi:putative A-kinase anchor protein 17A-like [Capsicum annuum]|uniref:uncharacterized protein LOC107849784 n=1 Tax=Capsicum annuum TaxID=4072 RepID=UPI001FB05FD9|nr:uncharacterized protein LOC107849784 [Capsicum annuum]KAF3659752.1 putative A-kinase anchor protein 17A-like [Capsicum annuum]